MSHPIITDLRAMTRAIIPRLRDAGQHAALGDEPLGVAGDAFDVLFVRLLEAPAKSRSGGAYKALRAATFELRIVYDAAGKAEATSSQAMEDAEALLVGMPDEARIPPASAIQHVRFLSAQIDRKRREEWMLHAELDVLYVQS